MRRWRERLCAAGRRHRHAERRDPAGRAFPPSGSACWSGAPTPSASGPAPTGQPPYVRPGVTTVAIFAGAFRSWHGAIHLVEAIKILRARGEKDIGAVFVGDGPELPRVRQAAAGHRHDRLHRRAAARSDARGARRRRHRRGAVRHRRARAAVARVLLVAAEDLRIHGGRTAGRRAGGGPDSVARRQTAARVCCTISAQARRRSHAEALADALVKLNDVVAAQRLGRRGARARRARLQLGRALPRARSGHRAHAQRTSRRMRILIPTDAFPPVCGGSGWSTYELARGLRARGHDVDDRAAAAGTASGRRARRTTTASASSSSARRRPTSRSCGTTTRARS